MQRRNKIHVTLLAGLLSAFIALPSIGRQPVEPFSDAKLTGGQYAAVVEYVDDGDTFIARIEGQRFRIRLSDIDAPEVNHCKTKSLEVCLLKGQPYGVDGGDFLRSVVLDRAVTLRCTGYDGRYQRNVCRVYAGNMDVNLELVARGLAWFNTKYSRDAAIKDVESRARVGRLGFWSTTSPVQPWVWRDNCWKHRVCPDGI